MFDDFCWITHNYTIGRYIFHHHASCANLHVVANFYFSQYASMAAYGDIIADGRTSVGSAADCRAVKAAEIASDGFGIEYGRVGMGEPETFSDACCWRDEEAAVSRAIPSEN